ncbi:hypothetical protein SAMN05421505_1554 [Sinosporangium album]|uniref:Uncharacterized protein n=1 Tax=Sinosporangium album TaxID=504805 RepID=A0A1G8KTI0_9ACTN|nr:hypothetical protein [Sinosporangium album]SDI46734.1 hypothetical protein SAMN05421505_1554 [Sinosporangium album]
MSQHQTRAVTLGEWAQDIGRSTASIRSHWRGHPDFPRPVARRPTAGPGPGVEVYDLAELEAWRTAWETGRDRPAPQPYEVPGEPEEMLTLGAIARRLGLDGKTVTQYRPQIEDRAVWEQRGQRRLYRLADVVDVLNARRGVGLAADPAADRRRKTE